MTTTIRINLPIQPGATTCDGCPYLSDLQTSVYGSQQKASSARMCRMFRKNTRSFLRPAPASGMFAFETDRLPECIAGERIKTGESWEVQCVGGHRATGFRDRADARWFVRIYCTGRLMGSRPIHVTRYRRAVQCHAPIGPTHSTP